ncbi:hypothetical protein NV63_16780 [Elizabethkingia anophelis]|nr:hypothetical protein NV63_16780 [Elizabethkingia anophelis]
MIKEKLLKANRRFFLQSLQNVFEKNNKRFQNNQRSIIYNGNYVRYEDMTAEQKKDFDKAMKEAQKARDYINSSEYKKNISGC